MFFICIFPSVTCSGDDNFQTYMNWHYILLNTDDTSITGITMISCLLSDNG